MRILFLCVMICLSGCGFLPLKEITKKEISDDNIEVKWYYYSYISDFSPQIIEVERDGVKKKIYESDHVVANIYLKKHNIIIRTVKPAQGIVYTENIPKEVFGYEIILDSAANIEELFSDPNKEDR